MDRTTSRRDLLRLGTAATVTAAAFASVGAAARPAQTRTPFRIAAERYYAATAHFNNLPDDLETIDPEAHAREEGAYIATVEEVDRAACATWDEFGEAFEIATDNGCSLPNEELVMKLLDDVRRLRASGGAGARHA